MYSKKDRDEAIESLRQTLKPGDTCYTLLKHVSRSGMSRIIGVHAIQDNKPLWLSYRAGEACGIPYNRQREGLRVGGCGTDMGFHVVYSLSATLYRRGFGCIGSEDSRDCPSNDHSNGDRDYHRHGERTMLGCWHRLCSCHDPSAWIFGETYPQGCSDCGCAWAEHWHQDGGYALRHQWLS